MQNNYKPRFNPCSYFVKPTDSCLCFSLLYSIRLTGTWGRCWTVCRSLWDTDPGPDPGRRLVPRQVGHQHAPPPVNYNLMCQLAYISPYSFLSNSSLLYPRLGREQAEGLLICSGDFLVRESSSASGQYVLSGMEGATVRHLLLVDPHGQVRVVMFKHTQHEERRVAAGPNVWPCCLCVSRCGPVIRCFWVLVTWCVSTWRTRCQSSLETVSCAWKCQSCKDTHMHFHRQSHVEVNGFEVEEHWAKAKQSFHSFHHF